jgi:hypothetical protein
MGAQRRRGLISIVRPISGSPFLAHRVVPHAPDLPSVPSKSALCRRPVCRQSRRYRAQVHTRQHGSAVREHLATGCFWRGGDRRSASVSAGAPQQPPAPRPPRWSCRTQPTPGSRPGTPLVDSFSIVTLRPRAVQRGLWHGIVSFGYVRPEGKNQWLVVTTRRRPSLPRSSLELARMPPLTDAPSAMRCVRRLPIAAASAAGTWTTLVGS